MLESLTPNKIDFLTTDSVSAVYVLTHPSGKKYIGSSGKVGTRLSGHKSMLSKGRHFVKAFQSDYDEVPEYDVAVYVVKDREEAYILEQALLDKYFPLGVLYNNTPNAKYPGLGRVMTQEERERSGRVNRGKQFSPEWRTKISDALKGKTWTAQQRERFIKNRTGIPITPEHREHLDRLNNSRKKKISGDGVIYNGLMEAAAKLGVAKDNIRHRIRSHLPQWANWFYVE